MNQLMLSQIDGLMQNCSNSIANAASFVIQNSVDGRYCYQSNDAYNDVYKRLCHWLSGAVPT